MTPSKILCAGLCPRRPGRGVLAADLDDAPRLAQAPTSAALCRRVRALCRRRCGPLRHVQYGSLPGVVADDDALGSLPLIGTLGPGGPWCSGSAGSHWIAGLSAGARNPFWVPPPGGGAGRRQRFPVRHAVNRTRTSRLPALLSVTGRWFFPVNAWRRPDCPLRRSRGRSLPRNRRNQNR